MSSSRKIPEGFSTLTPSLNIADASSAIELYKKAFGAKEESRMSCPDTGKIMHSVLSIGSSKLFVADANTEQGCGPTNGSFYVYLDDVDASFKTAKQAGLEENWAVQDMFWGDRTGTLKDKFGNSWTLATHFKDVSPEEMEKGRKEFMEKMKQKKAA